MRSGTLRHRIEIQWDRSTSQDDYGQPEESQETSARRWAQVLDLSGRELAQAQQTKADVTVQVRMRFFDGLTTAHRIKIGDRILAINHVANPDGRKIETLCMCSEARD